MRGSELMTGNRMKETELEGWVPYELRRGQTDSTVDWCNLGNRRFTEPFFDETINNCRQSLQHAPNYRRTSLGALSELAMTRPGIKPSGFIFHTSRCGSTLVAQMLSSLPQCIVISAPCIITSPL